MNFFQRSWLVAKEFGVVAYATRVPALVVALMVALLILAEPAQDMLAEAVSDAFDLGGKQPGVDVPESHWPGRTYAIVGALIALASSAWYWARVVLMFHRAMPDLAVNPDGYYRSTWRPGIVLWWPRLVGMAAFWGCAGGLQIAATQYDQLEAANEAGRLHTAAWITFGLGVVFLVILVLRRRALAGLGAVGMSPWALVNTPWALNGSFDPRAPFLRVRDLRASGARAPQIARHVGNIFLAASLALTAILIAWAGFFPVTLGDLVGGLAIAELAAAIAIPWFTLLTILTVTTRFPWFGLAAVFVVFLPTFNGCVSRQLDNHDVRIVTVDKKKVLPDRPTVDDAFNSWLNERRDATTVAYDAQCVAEAQGMQAKEWRCRSPEVVKACSDRPGCQLVKQRPPFIVVATEGGASRAGYWTALSLGELLRQDPQIRDSIFAISSVSGGSLGAVLMRALIDLDRIEEAELGLAAKDRVVCKSGEAAPQPYLSCVRVFMRRDFLASAFAGMFYTDLLQRAVPAALFQLPDRAKSLELSWEESWDDLVLSLQFKGADPQRAEALRKKAVGLFGKGFVATWGRDAKAFGDGAPIKPWPILLLNGTNVETGRRVVTSNVDAVTPAFPTAPPNRASTAARTSAMLPCVAALTGYGRDESGKQRIAECRVWEAPAVDDPFTTLRTDIPLSTAVNMSARFPVVEPAGGIKHADSDRRAYHVVDGGIYENFGAQTTRDLLHYILAKPEHRQWPSDNAIRPMVILISSDHELDGVRQVAAAYAGTDDRAGDAVDDPRLPAAERSMKLACSPMGGPTSEVPLCSANLMRNANEVLGDPVALYRTRSGRGESGILSLRELLTQWGFDDESFFHFRQCKNRSLRPASMTWYVSPISQRFMDQLLPSVQHGQADVSLPFTKWMALTEGDPCQNHAELKRLINRYERISKGER